MDSLSSAFNAGKAGESVRFTHVDNRAVSMKQTFDRPLVIGFDAFDVKVVTGGGLSVPIPSFAVLARGVDAKAFRPHRRASTASTDEHTTRRVEK